MVVAILPGGQAAVSARRQSHAPGLYLAPKYATLADSRDGMPMQRLNWTVVYLIAAAVIIVQVIGLGVVIWFDTWRGPVP